MFQVFQILLFQMSGANPQGVAPPQGSAAVHAVSPQQQGVVPPLGVPAPQAVPQVVPAPQAVPPPPQDVLPQLPVADQQGAPPQAIAPPPGIDPNSNSRVLPSLKELYPILCKVPHLRFLVYKAKLKV